MKFSKTFQRRLASFLLTQAFLLFLSSCTDVEHVGFVDIKDEGWTDSDTLLFKIDSVSSTKQYVLNLLIRCSSLRMYPYRQLMVETTQIWSDSNKKDIDTVTWLFPKGDHYVRSNGISVFSYTVPIDTVFLTKGDSGSVRIRHLMRKTPLEGVESIGVLLK